MVDWGNFFDQPVRNDLIADDNIPKIATGQGDNYTTGCLLDYNYFKKYYKMIAIYLSKQQGLDSDLKAIKLINFTENLENNVAIFFFIEEVKETVVDFSQGIVKVYIYIFFFCFNIKWIKLRLWTYNCLISNLIN